MLGVAVADVHLKLLGGLGLQAPVPIKAQGRADGPGITERPGTFVIIGIARVTPTTKLSISPPARTGITAQTGTAQ